MSSIAHVQNGQIVQSATTAQKEAKTANSSLDKDAFLQLLVAQMKYQDPLQPTSNTEYISQLATFSELEEMQNLTSGMTLQRASSLVGQYVFMKVTDSSGNTTYPEGQVDYVVYEGNKAYLSINETLYSIDDLDTVADSNYLVASRLAESFVNELNKLPKVEQVAQSDMKDIAAIMLVYENMTEYQRNFLGDETKALYTKYAQKHQTLAVEPVKEFIQDMKKFADSDEIVITEENEVAAEGLVERYNRLSSYQQSLFASDSEELYNTIAKKYEEYIKSKEQ